MWNIGPLIEVKTIGGKEGFWSCQRNGEPVKHKDGDFQWLEQKYEVRAMGLTTPLMEGYESKILIASDVVGGALSKAGELLLECTVLHELVHYFHFLTGQDGYSEASPEAFEMEAYGRIMSRTWETCMSDQYYEVKGK